MAQKIVIESRSAEETGKIGYDMGLEALPGQVYTLIGDLGVGKTVFTQGFAEGLGVKDNVNSPTFTILQIYEGGRLPLYHFDVYRIGDSDEMLDVGWDDYAGTDGVCLIEWADQIVDLIEELPAGQVIRIEIEKDPEKGFDYRRIIINRP